MKLRMLGPVLALIALILPTTAQAVNFEEYTTAWRIAGYPGGYVVAFYTAALSSGCTQGKVAFNTGVSQADRDRFWSLLLTARVTNKKVGIFFTGTADACYIDSFYLVENS